MKWMILILSGCFLFLIMGSISLAAGKEAIALISSLEGNVEAQRAHQKGLQSMHLGDPLFEGDILFTSQNSYVSLLFPDGSLISVSPNSQLAISLRDMDSRPGGSMIASLSREVLKEIREIFSAAGKRETLTAVPGIRKKIEEEEKGVRVVYPRNSTILSERPRFLWKSSEEKRHTFLVSLTLKGIAGKLWTIQSMKTRISYPEGQRALDRGQTYFLRIESVEDPSLYDEVYFRVLDHEKAAEVLRLENKMGELRQKNINDSTPSFILTAYYMEKGLYHKAMKELDFLEKKNRGERFALEKKREILAKIGLWKRYYEVHQRLGAMK